MGDYSGSNSTDFRVAAGVCQKNIGYTYLSPVLSALDLSPAKFTSTYGDKMENRRKLTERKSMPKTKLDLQSKVGESGFF